MRFGARLIDGVRVTALFAQRERNLHEERQTIEHADSVPD